MRLLVADAPRFHYISDVSAFVIDLSIVTHCWYCGGKYREESQSMLC